MANNSYNLRGVYIEIQEPETPQEASSETLAPAWHYHYLMFIDLDETLNTKQSDILSIDWVYAQGVGTTGSITGNYPGVFPAAPANNSKVRTYFIGICKVQSTFNHATDATVSLSDLSGDPPPTYTVVASGDACSRKPPIIKYTASQLAVGEGFTIGIQSQIGTYTFDDSNSTSHVTPDYFAVSCCKVDSTSNNLNAMNIVNYPVNEVASNVLVCTPELNPESTAKNVVSVGCFDFTIPDFTITNGIPTGGMKTDVFGGGSLTKYCNISSNQQTQVWGIWWDNL